MACTSRNSAARSLKEGTGSTELMAAIVAAAAARIGQRRYSAGR